MMDKKTLKFMSLYLIIIIAVAFAGLYANIHSIALSHMDFLEPFESYETCVGQFYPKWWCMRVPKQNERENGFCHCGNGQLGTYQYGGNCFCYPNNPTFPYYTENKFFDYSQNKGI
jgi:hypothetical protein